MANHQLLSNVKHRELCVDTRLTEQFGDNVGGVLLFPAEFIEAHKEYPIYFQKNEETGEFQSIAIFGFANGENFYLNSDNWAGRYIPALMKKEPFLIGFQGEESNPVVHIDMDSPRLTTEGNGQRLFDDDGGETPYLQTVSSTLMTVHQGMADMQLLTKRFTELELLEPFTLDIEFNNGEKFVTNQYYTVNQDKLYALSDSLVCELHNGGLLQLAYFQLSSLGNVRYLIDKKNRATL